MTRNGKKILEFLQNFQEEVSLGFEEDRQKYDHNRKISCIKGGMIKY